MDSTNPSTSSSNDIFVVRDLIYKINKGHTQAQNQGKNNGKNTPLFTSNPSLMNNTDSSAYNMKAWIRNIPIE